MLTRAIYLQADAMGENSWLASSNLGNEGFYNKHGYKKVGEAILGNDNPAWDKDPVVVQVVRILVF